MSREASSFSFSQRSFLAYAYRRRELKNAHRAPHNDLVWGTPRDFTKSRGGDDPPFVFSASYRCHYCIVAHGDGGSPAELSGARRSVERSPYRRRRCRTSRGERVCSPSPKVSPTSRRPEAVEDADGEALRDAELLPTRAIWDIRLGRPLLNMTNRVASARCARRRVLYAAGPLPCGSRPARGAGTAVRAPSWYSIVAFVGTFQAIPLPEGAGCRSPNVVDDAGEPARRALPAAGHHDDGSGCARGPGLFLRESLPRRTRIGVRRHDPSLRTRPKDGLTTNSAVTPPAEGARVQSAR